MYMCDHLVVDLSIVTSFCVDCFMVWSKIRAIMHATANALASRALLRRTTSTLMVVSLFVGNLPIYPCSSVLFSPHSCQVDECNGKLYFILRGVS